MTTELPASPTWTERWKSFRFQDWLHRVISPGDSAHELAMGASVGIFVALTPLFGLHLVIILLVAFALQRLVRFNKALAIALSYVNNPVTFAPILWASYKVGLWFVPSAAGSLDEGPPLAAIDWNAGIHAIPRFLYGVGLPMLVGCLVLGVIVASISYPLTYVAVIWYRRRSLQGDVPADQTPTAALIPIGEEAAAP